MKAHKRKWPVFSLLVFAGLLLGCGTTVSAQNDWNDKAIASSESKDLGSHVILSDEENHLTVAMGNDGETLYLRITTFDRMLQQTMLHPGITVWLDPKGGTVKAFGIHFPAGLPPAPPGMAGMGRLQAQQSARDRPTSFPLDGQQEVLLLSPAHCGKGIFLSRSELEQAGLHLKMVMEKNFLIYELKIPLHDQTGLLPFHVIGDGGQTIGIGLDAGGCGPGRMLTGPGPRLMGFPGGLGGVIPAEGGQPPSGLKRGRMPEPLEIWTHARLAVEPPVQAK